jgi:hypothetical protein
MKRVIYLRRDLQKDLELCNAATPGPWFSPWDNEETLDCFTSVATDEAVIEIDWYDGSHLVVTEEDARFIVQAREGWPHAIERALELEEELTRCGNTLVELTIALKNDRKRADKAEALARELVAAIMKLPFCPQYFAEHEIAWRFLNGAVAHAKEVLGDE